MKTGTGEYRFSLHEIKQLALFFRKHEDSLPEELQNFFSFLESCIYNSMTIEEAERFFNEDFNEK
ncbi:hypothetical protein H0R92_00420 [Treponema sp. OMZ 840]|uniref:hypothetical protein n=1 Tax=Treponema sp. OMZ 840 TaxID=244313 RepID=UPI003D931015